MKTKTENTLQFMQAITWLTFVGLCVKTCLLLYTFLIYVQFDTSTTDNLYDGLNLSTVYNKNTAGYYSFTSLIIILFIIKTYLVYQVTKMFSKINFRKPFEPLLAKLISQMSYVALAIGILSIVIRKISVGISEITINPDIETLIEGPKIFIFLAGILFIIAQVLKRGVEIQAENDLTI